MHRQTHDKCVYEASDQILKPWVVSIGDRNCDRNVLFTRVSRQKHSDRCKEKHKRRNLLTGTELSNNLTCLDTKFQRNLWRKFLADMRTRVGCYICRRYAA